MIKHRKHVRFYCLLCFIALSLFHSISVFAAEKNPQKKLQLIKQELVQINRDLNKTKKTKSKALRKIKAFDAEIARVYKRLKQLNVKKRSANREIQVLKKTNTLLSAKIVENKAAVAVMARAIYQQGDDNYLKILMGQGDASAQSRMRAYSDYFYQAFAQRQDSLVDDVLESEKIHRALEAKLAEYALLLEKNKTQAKSLKASRKGKKTYLAKLNRQIKSKKQKISTLSSNRKTLEKLLKALKKRKHREKLQKLSGMSFAKHKGKLQWPVKGKIRRKYGQSRAGGGLKWRGLLFSAKSGEKVRVVDDGTVVFSDWLSGYGFVLIVDHGKKYMSLYGHNQLLLKGVGERVSGGDVIAEVGNSGRLDKSGLYFEIRRNGKPINPSKWLVSRKSR